MRTVLDFTDYKKFLNYEVAHRAAGVRGIQLQMAKAMDCQPPYLNRVLKGEAHLSLEQAEKPARFLGLSKQDSFYFSLMVMHTRASTRELKEQLSEQIEHLRERQLNLKDKLKVADVLTLDDQVTYYSAWYFAVIHVLVGIPEFQNREAIRAALPLAPQKVNEAFEFLLQTGLIKEVRSHLNLGQSKLHLGKSSPLVAKHHSNWRMKAIASLDNPDGTDLHYSSVVAISKADSLRIHQILIEAIERVRAVVKDSKEEVAYSYCLDLFKAL